MWTLMLASAFAATPDTLFLARGERRVLPVDPGSEVRVNCDREVARVYLGADDRSLEIEAVGPGSCAVTIDRRSIPLEVRDLAEAGEAICAEARTRFEARGLRVTCYGGVVTIGGATADRTVHEAATRFAARNPGVSLDLAPLARPQVELTLVFLEARRLRTLDAGVDWPDAVGDLLGAGLTRLDGGGAPTLGLLGPLTDEVSAEQVVASFEVLETRTARVTLGTTAHLEDGGTIWLPVSGVETATVEQIPFGLDARLTPTRVAGGYQLALDVRVSEEAPGAGGGEIRTIHRGVETEVVVREGETVVVATQTSNRSWESSRGLPGLHRIPVLGFFFGRKEREREPVRGAVLVTVSAPGEHPEWLDLLAELKAKLEDA